MGMIMALKASRDLHMITKLKPGHEDFPGSLVVKTLPCSAGGTGSILGQVVKIERAMQCSQRLNK